MYYNLPTKTTENVYHTINALTQQSRHGNLHGSLPLKTWHPTLSFRLIFGRCFFFFFCFSENRPQRVVGSSGGPVGWCPFFPCPSGWCCLASHPLGGAAFHLSSVGWCCLASSFGRWSLSCPSAPSRPGVFFFWEPAPPKGEGRRQHDQKKLHPQGRGGKAAPLEGRRRDHHSTN